MRSTTSRIIWLLGFAIGAGGCGTMAEQTSPWQYGAEIRLAPGIPVGGDQVTLHPTAAYGSLFLGGVEGERDDKLYLGGQVRYAPQGNSGASHSLWFGGEATYSQRRTVYDDPALDAETTNGWTLAALAGVPVVEGSAATVHGYAAAGMVKYGGSGPYIRIGIDVQPAFLRR